MKSLYKYWSVILTCTKCSHICHWCQLHLSMKFSWLQGAGAAACPQLSPDRCCQERASAHSASSGVAAPASPHPLLALDRSRCHPLLPPLSQPGWHRALTRPDYWKIRLKTPVLVYTILNLLKITSIKDRKPLQKLLRSSFSNFEARRRNRT